MIDWVYSLSLVPLVLVVLAAMLSVAALIWVGVWALGARAEALGAVSPGFLSPLGTLFALVIGFLAVGVWNEGADARTAVNREASALRTADLLADTFRPADAAQLHRLIGAHISYAVGTEWPAMKRRDVTLKVIPSALGGALKVALRLEPRSDGERVAQKDLVASLEDAADARRQRIIISQARVNRAKWAGVGALALLTLLGIACVHATRRSTLAVALGIFACAIAASIILIVSQDRPFGGPFGVSPSALEQVAPAVR